MDPEQPACGSLHVGGFSVDARCESWGTRPERDRRDAVRFNFWKYCFGFPYRMRSRLVKIFFLKLYSCVAFAFIKTMFRFFIEALSVLVCYSIGHAGCVGGAVANSHDNYRTNLDCVSGSDAEQPACGSLHVGGFSVDAPCESRGTRPKHDRHDTYGVHVIICWSMSVFS